MRIALISLATLFIIGGLIIPSKYNVKESILINAPNEKVYEQIATFANWKNWLWMVDSTTQPPEIKKASITEGIVYAWYEERGSIKFENTDNGLLVVWSEHYDSGYNLFRRWLSIISRRSHILSEGLYDLKQYCEETSK